jgi:flavin-dependent dehydrogenase
MQEKRSDLVILGGGLAGLSLALQVRQSLPEARITVLEKRRHPVPEAAFKVGESTVEVAAHYFGRVLGLRDHIVADQLPKLGLRFFFPFDDNSAIENRLELGGKRFAPCPSYQLDRGRFENFLAEQCLAAGIDFLDCAEIKRPVMGRRGSEHEIEFLREGSALRIAARWVVDASGRRAFLKRQFNLAKPSPHVGNAAWFRFKQHIKIDDWSRNSQWQDGHAGSTGRWYSTNHLMGQGYWVWLIPLASGSTSIGIVAAEGYHRLSQINSIEKAVAWLERHEPQCAAAVKENLHQLQDFRAIKGYAVECKQVFSAGRWGITGEAGFFHDPFYSPGSDFIALANTFLTDLIRRDLAGSDFRIRAFSYDRIFKRLYYGTVTAYLDQYGMFGNPRVMPVKILWDYLVYWSITAFIFMQGRTCQQTMYLRNFARLSKLGKLNHFMQDVFRQWHERTKAESFGGLINISEMPLIREANARLTENMSSRRFYRQFAMNVAQLETLACEIIEQSGLELKVRFRRSTRPEVQPNAFDQVFRPSSRGCL